MPLSILFSHFIVQVPRKMDETRKQLLGHNRICCSSQIGNDYVDKMGSWKKYVFGACQSIDLKMMSTSPVRNRLSGNFERKDKRAKG